MRKSFLKTRRNVVRYVSPLACSVLFLSSIKAFARVETSHLPCFSRALSSGRIIKKYDNCKIYMGTLGSKRALWGIEVKGKFKIQAYSDAGSKVVYANGREAFLFTSTGKSPDTLYGNEYFCIGLKGDPKAICAHGFLVPGSR